MKQVIAIFLLIMSVVLIFYVLLVPIQLAAQKTHAVTFCSWAVGNGIETSLGRGLTQVEKNQIEEVCSDWYVSWRKGGNYERGLLVTE